MATYYVDFGQTYNGNGSTYTAAASAGAAGAFNTLVGLSLIAGDIVWIRRSSQANNLSAQLTLSTAGVSFIGWPTSVDSQYLARPAGPRTIWDADIEEYAKVTMSSHTVNVIFSGVGQYVSRLDFSNTTTTGSNNYVVNGIAASQSFENISARFSSAVLGTQAQLNAFSSTGTTPKIVGLYAKGSSDGTVTGSSIVTVNSGASSGVVRGVTIDVSASRRGTYSTSTSGILNISNTAGSKPLVVENVLMNFNAAYTSHQGSAIIQPSGSCVVLDVLVNGQATSLYEGPGIYVAGNDSRYNNIQGEDAVGAVMNVGSGNVIELKNWHILYPMTSALITAAGYQAGGVTPPISISGTTSSNGNTLFVTNGSFTVNGSVNKLASLGSENNIFLNFTDYIAKAIHKTVGPYNYNIFSTNHNKTVGAWHYENRHGQVDTSNTYRTGGSNFSLKATVEDTLLGQNKRALPISPKGREVIWLTLTAGTNVVTLYGAYKNWVGTLQALPTLRDVGFTFDWIDSSNVPKYASTFTDGALVSDVSVWNNDPGLTAFKVTLTINLASAQTVPANVFLSPEYDLAGYMYIDPNITVS